MNKRIEILYKLYMTKVKRSKKKTMFKEINEILKTLEESRQHILSKILTLGEDNYTVELRELENEYDVVELTIIETIIEGFFLLEEV